MSKNNEGKLLEAQLQLLDEIDYIMSKELDTIDGTVESYSNANQQIILELWSLRNRIYSRLSDIASDGINELEKEFESFAEFLNDLIPGIQIIKMKED